MLPGIKADGTAEDIQDLLLKFTKKWGPSDKKIEWWSDLQNVTEAIRLGTLKATK